MQQETKKNKRAVNGILLLDKPIGITSNRALQTVKRLFNARKAGHTGSLDPLATGMLPIFLGQDTKFSQYLLEANKRYQVACKLGIETTTGDAEGEVIATNTVNTISTAQMLEILATFQGDTEQIPSMYSALKHHGQPLYKLARQGLTIERKPRLVTISKLELIKYEHDVLELDIFCSKGTYVRTLVEDIGKKLGCGAHVTALRRLSVGSYRADQMVTLEQIESLLTPDDYEAIDGLLLSAASVFNDWQEAFLSEAAIYYLRQGQAIVYPHTLNPGRVRLQTKDGQFLGIGRVLDDGKIAPDRLVC